jgi:hypothetical protein
MPLNIDVCFVSLRVAGQPEVALSDSDTMMSMIVVDLSVGSIGQVAEYSLKHNCSFASLVPKLATTSLVSDPSHPA